jgi:dihydroorotase
MRTSWHMAGGRIVDPSTGRNEVADLYVKNGLIADSPAGHTASPHRIDARGLTVVPGLIDLHVHFREPGNEQAETIETGSQAAARGGFTTVVTMPNTQPPVDTPRRIAWQIARAE